MGPGISWQLSATIDNPYPWTYKTPPNCIFFYKHEIQDQNQFGFRKNSSAVLAVERLVGDIVDGFVTGHKTYVTLCDLINTFDYVSHKRQLNKLQFYGIFFELLPQR